MAAARRHPLATPLLAFATSRLIVIVGFWVGARHSHRSLIDALSGWDGGWYTRIAHSGYPTFIPSVGGHATQSVIGFFPLYPLGVRLVDVVTPVPVKVAAVLASNMLGALAACLLWLLLKDIASERWATRGVWLFVFFPGAFVLSMAYAESLLLVLVLGAFLAAAHGRWLLTGVLAALATATRPDALVLGAALAVIAYFAVRDRRDWGAVLAPLLCPLGALAFVAYLRLRTGTWSAWFRAEREGWHNTFDFGHDTFGRVTGFLRHPTNVLFAVITIGLAFVAVAVLLLVRSEFWRSRWPNAIGARDQNSKAASVRFGVVVFAIASIALSIGSSLVGPRPRAILVAFPLVVAVAVWPRRKAFVALIIGSAILLGWLSAVTAGSQALTP